MAFLQIEFKVKNNKFFIWFCFKTYLYMQNMKLLYRIEFFMHMRYMRDLEHIIINFTKIHKYGYIAIHKRRLMK